MNLLECIRLAFNSLLANKLRALLTMLGIIIGISSVITITTLGKSVSKTLENSFNSLGLNYIYMYITYRDYDDENAYLTTDDLITKEEIYEFLDKYPDRFGWLATCWLENCTTSNYRDEQVKVDVRGISNGNFESNNYKLICGREITLRDSIEERHCCVVSDIFVEQYFRENEDPLMSTIDVVINEGEVQSFTIVGVYKAKQEDRRLDPGQKFMDLASTVMIPYETAMRIAGRETQPDGYAMMCIKSGFDFKESSKILQNYFNEMYKNNPRAKMVYIDPHDDMKIISIILAIVTGVFTLIAMISLVVGGIGVMNIMLVSIVERTREIGVRKALGAKNSSIRMQFVVEAIMICVIGGVIGILLGVGGGLFLDFASDFVINNFKPEVKDYVDITVQPSLIAIIGSVLFCMMTGVFFGFYPANKAAKMNPIDALRYD